MVSIISAAVESPVGTGFSYSTDNEDYTTTDGSVANDNMDFLLQFFENYKEFKNNDFYISYVYYSIKYSYLSLIFVEVSDSHPLTMQGLASSCMQQALNTKSQDGKNLTCLYHWHRKKHWNRTCVSSSCIACIIIIVNQPLQLHNEPLLVVSHALHCESAFTVT